MLIHSMISIPCAQNSIQLIPRSSSSHPTFSPLETPNYKCQHCSSFVTGAANADEREMKERQRWQPEEDALLRAYVKQYGPRDWNLISHRMGKPLDRDPKSCLERWKNYLKPGIKKGSLTPEEQSLVIALQSKYGNKWKKIAAEVPGRTAKRLGKWWEVFKEKQLKQQQQLEQKNNNSTRKVSHTLSRPTTDVSGSEKGQYDHILETFAEKYVRQSSALQSLNNFPPKMPNLSLPAESPNPLLSLGSTGLVSPSTATQWTPSPSVSLTLSPPEPVPVLDPVHLETRRFIPVQQLGVQLTPEPGPEMSRFGMVQQTGVVVASEPVANLDPVQAETIRFGKAPQMGTMKPGSVVSDPVHQERGLFGKGPKLGIVEPGLAITEPVGEMGGLIPVREVGMQLAHWCVELEEGRQSWVQQKKEANWRLSRLEQQLEAEKARKKREKMEEIEVKIRMLREEEMEYMSRIEREYKGELSGLQRDAENKEAKLMEAWCSKRAKLAKIVEQLELLHGHGTSSVGGRD
ncbi:hypothetical protein Ancab_005767 [Ancistrocladus abbreviatus]